MADRIYGDFQMAGVKITTVAKSQVSSAGTDAYALATIAVDAAGNVIAGTAANPNANPATAAQIDPVSVTTTKAAFANVALANGLIVTNDPDSTTTIFAGPSATLTAANGYKLKPGQSVSYGVSNASAISVITAALTSTAYGAGN